MRLLLDDQLSYDELFSLGYRTQERNRTALAFIECLNKHICKSVR